MALLVFADLGRCYLGDDFILEGLPRYLAPDYLMARDGSVWTTINQGWGVAFLHKGSWKQIPSTNPIILGRFPVSALCN